MGAYLLQTQTTVPLDVARVFAFFRDARNLHRIAPSWWRAEEDGHGPHDLRPGSMLTYRRRICGLRRPWRTEVTVFDPPRRFVEEQREGPYRWWVHTHSFTAVEEGTLMEDEINYSPSGAVPHRLILAPDLRRVFRARDRALRDALGLPPAASRVHVRIGRAR